MLGRKTMKEKHADTMTILNLISVMRTCYNNQASLFILYCILYFLATSQYIVRSQVFLNNRI